MPSAVSFPTHLLAERLQKVSILGALPSTQLKTLARWISVVGYEDGESVVRQGDQGDGLFLILEGAAEVRRGRRTLARLGRGQFFGEMSLFDNLPRSADVVAVKASKLGVLSKAEFWGFAASEPSVVLNILEEMSRRLRATNQALAD